MKYVILKLLRDKPMHGYEVMKALEEETSGCYKPSPGTVYPTLQWLDDEGLVKADDVDGKKVYAITDKGREFLNENKSTVEDIFERVSETIDNIVGEPIPEVSRAMGRVVGQAYRAAWKHGKDEDTTEAHQRNPREGRDGPREPDGVAPWPIARGDAVAVDRRSGVRSAIVARHQPPRLAARTHRTTGRVATRARSATTSGRSPCTAPTGNTRYGAGSPARSAARSRSTGPTGSAARRNSPKPRGVPTSRSSAKHIARCARPSTALSSRDLGERRAGSPFDNGGLISGIAAHDLYHAGQIQILKKLRLR